MSNGSKDVVYIDVDDEITAIIDKVSESPHKIVALVLPKRAAVLQSIVNMKLLKRSADDANKNLVLITSEPSLLPLAGAVGLHVAKTPQSKPTVPAEPAKESKEEEHVDESEADDADFDSKAHAAKSIGALAAADTGEDTIELDNEDTPPLAKAAKKPEKPKKGKDRKLRVPNFHKFRTRLGLIILAALLLIGFGIYALIALPKATIAIGTDTEEVGKTLDVTFDATADAVDVEKQVVPSVVERVDRTNTQKVAATGERNDGKKAEGEVVLRECVTGSPPPTVPAGTGVSTGGKNYIMQENSDYDYKGFEDGCFVFESDPVKIVAQEGGKAYNVSGATFSVAGSDATGTGSASGGTDKIVKILSQADIDSATKKLESDDDDSAKDELKQRLNDRGLYVIEDSFVASNSDITTDAKVGDEVDNVTATRKATYSMVGAREDDLKALIVGVVEQDLDGDRQGVLETGLDAAVFGLQNQQENAAKVLMSVDFTSIVGPKLDEDAIKEQVKGLKAAEAEALIGSNPGVTSVEVTYGPFWVSSVPKSADKITITYN